MMLNFATTLGINSPILGKRNSLITPLRLYRESQWHMVQLDRIAPLDLQIPLIQTSRLLATNSPDRLHLLDRKSEIGWDRWQPDRSSDRDDFDYKVDRSRFNIEDTFIQSSELESPILDFFTTALPPEFTEIDSHLDFPSANSIDIDVEISPVTKGRSTTANIQPQVSEEIQPKFIKSDRKRLDSDRISQIEQQNLSVKLSQVSTNIQAIQLLQFSDENVEKITTEPESSIVLASDSLASTSNNDLLPQPPSETSILATETGIDINLATHQSPAPNLTQIARFADDITANLASPPELIPVPIAPNLLDAPTIINHLTPPKIVPESALNPVIITPVTVPEQTATTTEIASITEFSDRLTSDPIALNSPDLPIIIAPQLSALITTQPLSLEQKSAAAADTPPVMPSAIEPVRESISDTLPVDRSDSPITNQLPSTDPAQISASLDEWAMANLDLPALPSSLAPSILPPLADRWQIATEPDRIAPEIQSSQLLIPATPQLNLAADSDNIDRELNSIQLEPANLNIPEPPDTLPAEVPTNLLPAPNPEQIVVISPTPIEANLQSTSLVSTDTSRLNPLDAHTINPTPSALEQISTFANEPIPENLESSPIPIVDPNTLSDPDLSVAKSQLPWRIDLDLTIKSIPTLSLDAPQSNMDRSILENTLSKPTDTIEIAGEKIAGSGKEFRSDNLSDRELSIDSTIIQTISNLTQETNSIELISLNSIDESVDVTSSIDNSTNPIQVDPITTALPTIGQEELSSTLIDRSIDFNVDNLADSTIPAPTVGYATGGYVKDANHIDLQSIATSDTVSAMLTPGEFVINAKDAQKNLDLLTHINRGGEPEATLPNPEIQPSIIESGSASPDIAPTSIQRKRNDSLISPSLQREISLQQLSPLINTELDPSQSSQTEGSNSSPMYSSPSMVFRKPMSSSQPQYQSTDTPDEWGSIKALINGSSNNSDPSSFENISSQQSDLESRASPMISPQDPSPTREFAGSGEVTPSDLSTTIEPITQTIESPINNPQSQLENNDPAELEILAREIYHRLRQRLEIERERHGSYSGNLAW
jgi:hypothetical protein